MEEMWESRRLREILNETFYKISLCDETPTSKRFNNEFLGCDPPISLLGHQLCFDGINVFLGDVHIDEIGLLHLQPLAHRLPVIGHVDGRPLHHLCRPTACNPRRMRTQIGRCGVLEVVDGERLGGDLCGFVVDVWVGC